MERYISIVIYVFLVLTFLYITKKIADLITRFNDDQAIREDRNTAVALRRFGLFVGFCTAMAGVMAGGISKLDILTFCLDGLIATVLFFLAHLVNQYLLAPGIDNNKAVKEGNIPMGLMEAGSFIATGILLNGAFTGDSGGLLSAAVFFILGQAVMVAAVKIHQIAYRFNVSDCLKDGNMSAGVIVAGLLVSYGIILRTSIAGNFIGWAESLAYFTASALTGIVCLFLFERIAGLIFLPGIHIAAAIREGNTAAVILVQGIMVALSLMLGRLL